MLSSNDDIFPGVDITWKSSRAVGTDTAKEFSNELQSALKETEKLNKKYAGKYFED